MESARHPRTFWERLSAEADREGAVTPVARRYGVKAATLSWWRWRLGRDGGRQRSQAPVLLPVAVGPSAMLRPEAPPPIEIEIRGVMLRFEAGVDVRYVASLIEALRESC